MQSSELVRRFTEQPLVRDLPVDAAQAILALRYCILCRRSERDPMPELERRWGNILAARRYRLVVEAMTKARRENAYWLPYVAEATSQTARLDRSRKGIAEVEAATPAELQALAKRYLADDKALVIKAVSDKAGK